MNFPKKVEKASIFCAVIIVLILYLCSYNYFFDQGKYFLAFFFPFLVIIAIIIVVILSVLVVFLILELDIKESRKWNELRNQILLILELQGNWTKIYNKICEKFSDIEELFLENHFNECYERLSGLKEMIETDEKYSKYNTKKNKFLKQKINPLLAKCKLQKEIEEKCSKLYLEFESHDFNLEIADKYFEYCIEISNLFYSKEISYEFFQRTKELKNKMNLKLKEDLIKKEMRNKLNSTINYDFLLDRPHINYYDILERWRILQFLSLENLKTIKSKNLQNYFTNGSLDSIPSNISILDNNNLQEIYLEDIGVLVRGKHWIQKNIRKNKNKIKIT